MSYTIQNVIDLAVNGELKTLSVKTNNDAIIGYLNLGMIELYKRFPLKTGEQILELQDGVTEYQMNPDFMWMVAAYQEVPLNSETAVVSLPINESDNPLSINMITYDTVQVPSAIDGSYVSIIYVTSPPMYTSGNLDDVIALPPQMIEALLTYIGYRANESVTAKLDSESNTYYRRFEASCARIVSEGMFTAEGMGMLNRIADRNFV